MIDFKLKLVLTILSSVLFSFVFILLALVLPTGYSTQYNAKKDKPQTEFQKMSEGIRSGFNK